MTAKQLIKKLQLVAPNTLVVQSRDEEGNGFSVTADVSSEHFDQQQYELTDGKANCIVLWPER